MTANDHPAVFEAVSETDRRRKPKLAEEFIKQIDGKDFVLYSGLLDLAHQKGLKSLEVEVLQFPTKENDNFVVCRATAISQNGESFIDFGDANLVNCNPKVAKHLIRMASTRAKARVLRDFTNIGITCLEELGDLNEVIGDDQARRPQKQAVSRKSTEPAEPVSTPSISEAQRRAILNLSKRRGIPEDQVDRMAQDQFGVSFSHLSSKDASSFIRTLQQAA